MISVGEEDNMRKATLLCLCTVALLFTGARAAYAQTAVEYIDYGQAEKKLEELQTANSRLLDEIKTLNQENEALKSKRDEDRKELREILELLDILCGRKRDLNHLKPELADQEMLDRTERLYTKSDTLMDKLVMSRQEKVESIRQATRQLEENEERISVATRLTNGNGRLIEVMEMSVERTGNQTAFLDEVDQDIDQVDQRAAKYID